MDNKKLRELRAKAQQLQAKVHVGKAGVGDAAVAELQRHLKKDKLVKVRLLPSATDGGEQDQNQAEALATAANCTLIEVRGHTAVYFKA